MLGSTTSMDYAHVQFGPGFVLSHSRCERAPATADWNSTLDDILSSVLASRFEIFRAAARLWTPQHNCPTTRERTPGGI